MSEDIDTIHGQGTGTDITDHNWIIIIIYYILLSLSHTTTHTVTYTQYMTYIMYYWVLNLADLISCNN